MILKHIFKTESIPYVLLNTIFGQNYLTLTVSEIAKDPTKLSDFSYITPIV